MKPIIRFPIAILSLLVAFPLFAQTVTWEDRSLSEPAALKGVYFLDAAHGYIVGDEGYMAATADSGTTWQKISVPTDQGLWGVYAVSGTAGVTIYAAGDNGTMLKSTNGGTTWATQDLKYTQGFTFHVFGLDADNLWVSGGEGEVGSTTGVIIRTTDGGATWMKSTIAGSYSFDKTFFTSQTVGYAVASHADDFSTGGIYKTTDGGVTWNLVKSTNGAMNAIHCSDENNCVATGFNTVALHTTDGGATWAPVELPQEHSTFAIFTGTAFVDAAYGYMTDALQGILVTTDGGATWEHDDAYNGTRALWGIAVGHGVTLVEDYRENVVVGVGDDGAIYRLKTSGPSPSVQVSANTIDFDTLEVNELSVNSIMVYPGNTAGLRIDSLWTENGTPAGEFYVAEPGGSFPKMIVAMGTMEIKVAMRGKVAGAASGTLYIKTNDPFYPIRQVALEGDVRGGASSVAMPSPDNPITARLLPNPLSGEGTMMVDIPRAVDLDISLVDLRGERVMKIFNGRAEVGAHMFPITGTGLPAGVYYCVTRVDGSVTVRPIVIAR